MNGTVVVQLCSASGMGGGEVHVADLCVALARTGADVRLVHRKNAAVADAVAGTGIAARALAPRNAADIVAAVRLARLLVRTRADILHAHMGRDYVPAAIALRLARLAGARTKLVLSRHHLNPVRSGGALALFAGDDCTVVAVSEAVRQSLRRSHPYFNDRTVVIPNWLKDAGGDSGPDKPALPVVAACVGELSPLKDPLTFVRAAKDIRRTHGPEAIRFVLVGAAKPKHRGYETMLRHEAGDAVEFAGNIPGVSERMGGLFDIVAITSTSEAFSLVLIEAMAAGCAAVATTTGGIPEILDRPELGLLFPVGDVSGLAGHLRRLADDPRLRADLGVAAKADVRRRFDKNAVVGKIMSLYEKIADARTHAS